MDKFIPNYVSETLLTELNLVSAANIPLTQSEVEAYCEKALKSRSDFCVRKVIAMAKDSGFRLNVPSEQAANDVIDQTDSRLRQIIEQYDGNPQFGYSGGRRDLSITMDAKGGFLDRKEKDYEEKMVEDISISTISQADYNSQKQKEAEEKEIEIPSQYLGPFGGYPTLLDWTKKYALFTVRQDDQDIYFLCDLETGDIKKYIGKYAPYFKYYSTTTSCIEDNVLALSMYGEDNQFYVCLINADTMKEIADPIAGESFSMEDKTLLIDQKELYDLSGNLLYTVEDGKKGELVSDGILQVTYSEEEKETVDGESEYVEVDKTDYYDLKGKKLFSEMDTADSKMVLEPSEEV